MKYYMILLNEGKVVDIASFDEEDARDNTAKLWNERIGFVIGLGYDDVQTLNIVC